MTPDYLICLECESPVYVFEWEDDKVVEALCTICGNDETSQFATEDEFEEMSLSSAFMRRERSRKE
jgi:hypothetical protein